MEEEQQQQQQQQQLTHSGAKRERDADGVDSPPPDPSKRLRADLECVLEGILDDAADDAAAAGGDLASVMRSLEEEIGLSSPAAAAEAAGDGEEEPLRPQPDLGFLLGASDDELGLPPTASEEASEGDAAGVPEAEGFGQIWGFEDEIPNCYDGFGGFGFTGDDAAVAGADGEAEGVLFHGGLFDGLGEEEHTWRQETLPAV